MKIIKLSNEIINQIAAGELIDSPASIIKELVENSIDAGATRIKINIRHGGKSYLRVEDNGNGMSKEDLSCCLDHHTTSKLVSQDLYNIQTLGFRGEALFSIGTSARIKIQSRSKNDNTAHQIHMDNGIKSEVEKCSLPCGTIIEVTRLFFNIPARLNFLSSEYTCQKEIEVLIMQFALQYNNIQFDLSDEKKIISRHSRVDHFSHRVYKIINDLEKNSITFEKEENYHGETYKLSGVLSVPTFNKSSKNHQHIFINGRYIKDPLITSTMHDLYKDYVPQNKYPVFVLYMLVPPHAIDVNIHPKKLQIKFRNTNLIQKYISDLTHDAMQSVTKFSRTQTINFTKSKNHSYTPDDILHLGVSKQTTPTAYQDQHTQHTLQYTYQNIENQKAKSTSTEENTKITTKSQNTNTDQKINHVSQHIAQIQSINQLNENEISTLFSKSAKINPAIKQTTSLNNTTPIKPNTLFDFPIIQDKPNFGTAICQIFNSYILSQTDKNNLVLIDQHAAHERINYEILKEKVMKSGSLPSQKLLTPIEMENQFEIHISTIESNILNQLGFEIMQNKNNAKFLLIKALPTIIQQSDAENLLQEIFYESSIYDKFNKIAAYKIDRICASIACHASIKAGQTMSLQEMNALIKQMEETPNIGQCNHGRPTHVFLSKHNLDHTFERC